MNPLDFQPLWAAVVVAIFALVLWRGSRNEPVDDRYEDARRSREAVAIARARRTAAEARLARQELYPTRNVTGTVREYDEGGSS